MDMVAKNVSQITPEFSRAYLNLFKMYPVKECGKPIKQGRIAGVHDALINLLPSQPEGLSPEDKELFRISLSHTLLDLPRAEREALVDAIISEKPDYRTMITKMTDFVLRM